MRNARGGVFWAGAVGGAVETGYSLPGLDGLEGVTDRSRTGRADGQEDDSDAHGATPAPTTLTNVPRRSPIGHATIDVKNGKKMEGRKIKRR